MEKRPRFDWDEANTSHISRHGVTPPEAEQVITGDRPLEIAAQIREGELRRLCIGPTDSGRILTIVYTVRGRRLRVVTAYPASRDHRRLYATA